MLHVPLPFEGELKKKLVVFWTGLDHAPGGQRADAQSGRGQVGHRRQTPRQVARRQRLGRQIQGALQQQQVRTLTILTTE